MTDINHLTIIGRVVRDLDGNSLGYTQGGTSRLGFSIAVNRSRKSGDQWVDDASFFDVTVWGKTAENIKPYIGKGKQIAVDGYIEQQRWERDGKTHSKVVIVASQVQLVGGRTEAQPQSAEPAPYSVMDGGEGIPF